MSEGHDYLSKNLVTYPTMMSRIGKFGKFKIKTLNIRTDDKFSVSELFC